MEDKNKKYNSFIGKDVRVFLTPLCVNSLEGEVRGSTALTFGEIQGHLKSTGAEHRVLDGKLQNESEEFLELSNCTFWYDLHKSTHISYSDSLVVKKDEVYMMGTII